MDQNPKPATPAGGVTVATTTVKRACPICGTEYEAVLSELNRGWGQTCSRSCNGKLQREKEREKPGCSLLPRCGVTDDQVREVLTTAPNARTAAKRLGVGESHLRKIAAQHGIRVNSRRPRQRCVSREDIAELANDGFTRPDVAHLLGISPAYLKDLIAKWDLAGEFKIARGKAAAVTRNGYAWAAGRSAA